jgi:hypothetical protein
MSYNGSGTFLINTSGQPVVTGTPISSTVFNALTADLATGLSTAITKDGQTATTARIPFAQGISSTLVTDSTSTTTGSIITAGGAGVAKALFVGTTANVAGAVTLQSTLGVTGITTFSAQPIFSSLTASSAVATDASKGLVSVTNTGTGNNVLSTSPTLVTPALGTPTALVGTNITGTAANFNINGTVGATTPAAGAFTTLSASSTLGVTGVSTLTAGAIVQGLTVGRGAGAVSGNTIVGASALAGGSQTGTNLTALGFGTLNVNSSGGNNTAIGASVLQNNTTASDNTHAGYQAGFNNTTGGSNSAFGVQALVSNTTASYNTAVGYQASYAGTTGERNTNLGYQAGYTPTTASESTFVGYKAGYAKTTGDANTFIGNIAGTAATTGVGNTFVGSNSGSTVTTGGKNTILGSYNGNQGSLDIRTSSNYIVLSDGDGNPRMYHDGSSWLMGNNSTSGTVRLQLRNDGASKLEMYYAGTGLSTIHTGINTSSQFYVFNDSNTGVYLGNGATSWSSSSDERLKNIIEPITNASQKLKGIRSVIGTYKADEHAQRRVFFIAQDFAQVLPEALNTFKQEGDETEYLGLQYTDAVPLVAAAVNEHTDLLTEMAATIAQLKAEFDAYKASHP